MGEAVQFSGATVGPEEIAARIGVQPGQREAMTRWLRARGVRYFVGRKGPWTTVQALNAALAGESPQGPAGPLEIEISRGAAQK